MNFPIFITVEEDTPLGSGRLRKINLNEVESVTSLGQATTFYTKSGRKIEVHATEAEVANKISGAYRDAAKLLK